VLASSIALTHESHLVLVTRLEVQEVLGSLELAVGPGEVLPHPLTLEEQAEAERESEE
jgi:hypothetical protein